MHTQTAVANEMIVNTGLFPEMDAQATRPSKKMLWAGGIVSALPALMLLSSGINMARKASFVMEGFSHLGYSESVALGLGITEFLCALLYVIPRTSFLGAILVTGYLGGATASHVRVGDPFFPPVLFGVLVWLGLFLRDKRLRALLLTRGQDAR